MNYTQIIKEVGRGVKGATDLDEETAYELYGNILDHKVPPLELGAILVAFRIKGESEAEMLGFHRALAKRINRMQRPAGKPYPVVLPAYNGARKMANLLPLLALLLQRHGVPVLIHGVTRDPKRVTAAETLSAMGVTICNNVAEAQADLDQNGLAFITARGLSEPMDDQLELRWRLGVRGSTHTLAKLVDPFAGESVRVVSVTHPPYMVRMASFMQAANTRGLLMRGAEGEPYANPKRCPRIEFFHDGTGEEVMPQDEGDVEIPQLADDFDVETTVRWTQQALAGEIPIPKPIIKQLACCLYASGAVPDMAAALAAVKLA
ncbi:anthranilate phosphoribosyltransferase [Novimethylophilus kurashikiensis]|uniref:Anthranilate phosphoribosyltransferase n=1 Tax=Novimethylophilus kurashikiensis TaxID=1825523 RepID=A0A2R5F1V5_9PROT|nr:DNA-binding protein YbiB [Novimethylophilus kurashikiensis]GBG12475.1 anthranilate phosphoribosyltransferase [Novimethylophilus kurashikiensis]